MLERQDCEMCLGGLISESQFKGWLSVRKVHTRLPLVTVGETFLALGAFAAGIILVGPERTAYHAPLGGGAERGTASSGPASASTEKGASASLVKCGLPWATKRLGAPRRDLGSQASRVRARAMPEECEACKGGSRHRPMSSR